jgi:hypothetical protein
MPRNTALLLAAMLLPAGPAFGAVPDAWWSQELPPEAMRQALPDLQSRLKDAGCYAGQVDGRYGPQTRRAIQGWQRAAGVPQTGIVSEPLMQSVGTMGLRCAPSAARRASR